MCASYYVRVQDYELHTITKSLWRSQLRRADMETISWASPARARCICGWSPTNGNEIFRDALLKHFLSGFFFSFFFFFSLSGPGRPPGGEGEDEGAYEIDWDIL